jgi:hypothetical protein
MTDVNQQILDKLAVAVEMLTKHATDDPLKTKTPAQFSNYTPLHGSGGIFAVAGLERDIITAHVRPEGIATLLPRIPTVYQDPRFGSITGFTSPIGSQPDHACDDAPYGYMKGCNLTARFGRIRYDTNTIDMNDTMLKLHRGDFTDLILRGRLLGLNGITPSGINEGEVLNIIVMSEMIGAAVQYERTLVNWLWQGSTAIANQFPGLDAQIATAQEDADTGTLCPALDSDVKNFGYQEVCGTTRDIVEYISMLEHYITNNARKMGLEPATWAFVMRADLWYELSACWPCRYNTSGCTVFDTAGIDPVPSLDSADMTTIRDNMRNGMFIMINGKKYPVLVDDGIFEHNNINNANCRAGEYASTIYMVPLTIGGGFPVTYIEYVDYRQATPQISVPGATPYPFFWTDNGFFSWAREDIKWCFKYSLKNEPRVVLRTPQLAGRIDAVKYSPLQHLRDSDPSSVYHKDGGVSIRGGLSTPHAVWSGR